MKIFSYTYRFNVYAIIISGFEFYIQHLIGGRKKKDFIRKLHWTANKLRYTRGAIKATTCCAIKCTCQRSSYQDFYEMIKVGHVIITIENWDFTKYSTFKYQNGNIMDEWSCDIRKELVVNVLVKKWQPKSFLFQETKNIFGLKWQAAGRKKYFNFLPVSLLCNLEIRMTLIRQCAKVMNRLNSRVG